ncbi:MAG: retropepsin-like aspartic protease [Alphaproteobacteria bacterium]
MIVAVFNRAAIIGVAFAALLMTPSGEVAPLTVPFDFSRNAIGLNVTVKGAPLYMILDTGADPSGIDEARAAALGLKIDRAAGGEASGEGNDKQVKVYPTVIQGLVLGGRSFGTVNAVTLDMRGLSARYRRRLDGVLGFSFLNGKIALIDYAARRLSILERAAQANSAVRSCRKHLTIPYRSIKGDIIPIIPHFRFGAADAPISLDTGSSRGISLFQSALALPGLRAALKDEGEVHYMGARGVGTGKGYRLDESVGFGPFTLPKGQAVALFPQKGSPETRVANIGNKFFAAATPKMLLDYRNHTLGFYGDCR